jgi:hypothetical protein
MASEPLGSSCVFVLEDVKVMSVCPFFHLFTSSSLGSRYFLFQVVVFFLRHHVCLESDEHLLREENEVVVILFPFVVSGRSREHVRCRVEFPWHVLDY